MDYQALAEKFNEHSRDLLASKDATAKYRANSYARVASKIEAELKGKATAEGINNLEISDYMKNKAIEFLENKPKKSKAKARTKSKSKAKSPAKSPKTNLKKELTAFMGIGPEKAAVLIQAGLKNINQLHMKKYRDLLPEETKTFIDLKPQQQIPHDHIKILEPFLLKAADDITIVGSYRRKKPYSSDIDLMVISDDEDAINNLLESLRSILNDKVYPYSKGRDKMSLIVDMSDLAGTKAVYKIDAFRTLPADKIPMLLYSTGSKEFNVMMRSKAKKLGYLLNQKGLFKDGKRVEGLKSEEDYFKILGMPYKEPTARV